MNEQAELFRAPAATTQQDWDALGRYLARLGHVLSDAPPQQFAGGFGNLNYALTIDETRWVLRRPPMGPIPPGANDMLREHRMLSALSPVWPLVPKPLVVCEDRDVLGRPFLIMEYRPGLSIGGTLPDYGFHAQDEREAGRHLSRLLIDTLAHLHGIDPQTVGLGAFGKPDGFLDRAIAGWSKRADLALDGKETPAALTTVVDWLRSEPTPRGDLTLLHNDFKLDNLLLDETDLTPLALVDWDMGSHGDPLFDLATLLSYWTEPGDPDCLHRLSQMPTAAPGFWSRDEAAAAYAATTGRDISNLMFYRVLTLFKLAVVFLQLEARADRGEPVNPKIHALRGLGMDLLDYTAAITPQTKHGHGKV